MNQTTVESALASIDRDIEVIYRESGRFPWSDPRPYADWLAQTYFYTRHVSRVSAHAVARTPIDRPELHDHFLRTLHEEKDHPPMALDDLRELGFTIDDFQEHPLTTALYQTLRCQIDTVGPVALIGYFFVIEGAAAKFGREVLAAVRKGHNGRGIRFLEEHVIEDAVHFPAAQQFVSSLAHSDLATVAKSASLAAFLYSHMIRGIANHPTTA